MAAQPSPIRDILRAIGEAIVREMLRGLNENGKYPLRRNSALVKSLRVEVTQGRGAGGRFEGYTANSALALYAKDYAVYLDAGRRPGGKKVPISALLQFIKNRGIGQARGKNGRFGARSISANQLAWMIQNSIYVNGLKGRSFIAPALKLGSTMLELHLDTEMINSLTMELEKSLKLI
jgi:hypothetical protein